MKEILCTLGPSSMNEKTIRRLDEIGVSLFRINLSHTRIEDLEERIRFIQSITKVPVCLDSEGAQVRTGDFKELKFFVEENAILTVHRHAVQGDASHFNFYPLELFDDLQVGDLISIDFNAVLVQVIQKDQDRTLLRVLNEGFIGKNKAVTIERSIDMSPLTDKDRKAFEIGKRCGIRHVALSFANRATDVDEVRKVSGSGVTVISKIECNNGLQNLVEIIQTSDAILIDRGDLSREQPIEKIPFLQKRIIATAQRLSKKVYVATNLLESMVTEPGPTRAEVNDIYNTLNDGADGLVLAAETAIGKYPINCAVMISKIIQVFEQKDREDGGRSAQPVATPDQLSGVAELTKLRVRETDLMDCEQIAFGTYSPLQGFMTSDELKCVLETNKLPNDNVWTLPIVLQMSKSEISHVRRGERVALTDQDGEVRSLMDVEEVYSFDFQEIAQKWFGTTSLEHPGVLKLRENGDCFIGGKITLVKQRPSAFAPYELTPTQTRFLFEKKGWQRVVGFHSRNVPHRVHEYLQLTALEQCHADGLLISPVIGPKKAGDFLTDPILKSYQLLIDRGFYPKGKVVLGGFSTYSRYAGPREAVFTALCRKNMGCSHFILGRDHTGVGNFYAADSNKKIFDEIGPIGITPIFFDSIGYDKNSGTYGPSVSIDQAQMISGSTVREKLRKGEKLPDWFMRRDVQELLTSDIQSNLPVFCS